MKNEKKTPRENVKAVKMGTYSTVISLVVIAVAVVINLIVSSLPASITKFDTTESAIYSISKETEEIVKAVNEKVRIYLVAENGAEDNTILEVLNKYKALNSNISVDKVDPVTHPAFTSEYTSDDVYPNSLIVESDKRSKVVSYYDIYVTTYSEEDYYNYYQYGVTPQGTRTFAAESEITSAIDYVTTDILPTMYLLSGHGEAELPESTAARFKTENIETNSLRLLTLEAVPADASCILVNCPTSDITDDEYEMLLTYLKSGGKLILFTDPLTFSSEKMPNVSKIAAYFGVAGRDGVIMEGDSNNYYRSRNILIPQLNISPFSDIISTSNMYVMAYTAHGISKTDDGGVGTVTPILTTTVKSYLKSTDSKTTEKEDGDEDGPFYVGIINRDSDSGAAFVWFSCANILADQIDYMVSGGNSTLFMAAATTLCQKASSVSIAAKSLSVTALSVPEGTANIVGALVTLVIPIAIVVLGFVFWTKRRKK